MTTRPAVDADAPSFDAYSLDELTRLVNDPAAGRLLRLSAGAELAQRGDPRPGVLTLELEWCSVAAGTFTMGGSPDDVLAFDRERPQHSVPMPAFRMSRYPVTNGQWSRFVSGGGYDEPQWWMPTGWSARNTCGWTEPRFWSDTSWAGNQSNRPVVGVSWYEAIAYAKWLSSQLGYDVRVCSEAEWEKAARGQDGRTYPCGAHLDADAVHASSQEQDCGAAAPVGCYPLSISPWGIEDLVGNTYAWTRSRWGPAEARPGFGYPYVADDGREGMQSDDYRVVRGGAWNFPLRNARCSYRGKDLPDDVFRNVGVRLVAGA